MEDEQRFADLVKEAQLLVGRLSHCIHHTIVELYGRRWDAIESLLSTASISSLFSPIPIADYWFMSLSGARSQTRQALGRLQTEKEQEQIRLSPEAVARWQRLIALLERLRGWAVSRPAVVDRWLRRIETSKGYRVAAIVGTFGGFVAAIFLLVSIIAVIVGVILLR